MPHSASDLGSSRSMDFMVFVSVTFLAALATALAFSCFLFDAFVFLASMMGMEAADVGAV